MGCAGCSRASRAPAKLRYRPGQARCRTGPLAPCWPRLGPLAHGLRPKPGKGSRLQRLLNASMLNTLLASPCVFGCRSPVFAHHVIAERAQIRDTPAVDDVFGHAFLGKSLEPVRISAGPAPNTRTAAFPLSTPPLIPLIKPLP